ncbi:MAG: Na+/H+ antiporter NhaC family protein [Bacteroidaceae bacterium]|nr:Na+/H+ antiporter NhaC family protein [Bacteroidaceae bacterium]
MRGSINERVEIYSRGAGQSDLLLMVWIFLLAGSFASTAKAMGAIDAAVQLTLSVMPASMLLPGLFVAACLISFSIGTSVGTIAALVPIAAAMADSLHVEAGVMVGSVVGGSFFGDNLSFISDTTIVATRTQGVRLKDKFLANFRIALPAALLTLAVYVWLGLTPHAELSSSFSSSSSSTSLLLTLPYLAVIGLALAGVNVLLVLLIGNVLAGVVGLCVGQLTTADWAESISSGMAGMQETILIALMAGGLLAVVRHGGGIDWVTSRLTRRVSSRRGAEGAIAALVALTNCLTANNTVAILSVGGLCSHIGRRYGVDPRRSASLLDTYSCVVQGLLPYGAQLLIAAGLASLPAMEIVPCLYYNFLLFAVATLYILK